MKTLELKKATKSLADYARKLATGPVIITVSGQPVAALVGIEDADLETVAVSSDPKFQAIIAEARARQRSGGSISLQEMRQRVLPDRRKRRVS